MNKCEGEYAKEIRHFSALLEEVLSQNQAMLEVVSDMRQELNEVKILTNEIPEMKADIKTIKAALTDTNTQVLDHEHRITKLESRAA